MKIGIGIDTGGTYTDIVAFDYDSQTVICKEKTLTTKSDLTQCISAALDSLSSDALENAIGISLSTTLATNACVEGKGGRGKLLIIGIPQFQLTRVNSKEKYGLDPSDVLCIDANGSFNGKVIDEPDWEKVYSDNQEWFESAQSLCISELNALRNQAVVEKHAREYFCKKLDVPISIATDLAGDLNVLERGATALLNSRLLPLISDFVDAVNDVIHQRGLDIPVMIVRSDGSLMNEKVSRERPVETILSGPAASVMGGCGTAQQNDCLIVDIGGTTTDISVVKDSIPVLTDTIRIGGWATQVKGVFIDTYGLGGDSIVRFEGKKLYVGTKRVVPLCIAASKRPEVITQLEELVSRNKRSAFPDHEFLYILKRPESLDSFTDAEKRLLETLADGPVMMLDERIDVYNARSYQRLEDEGYVMRCGFTPTDAMHLKGDFERFEKRASYLAASHFAYNLYGAQEMLNIDRCVSDICDRVYNQAKKRLHYCVINALLAYRYPKLSGVEVDSKLARIINEQWDAFVRGDEPGLMEMNFNFNGTLVGIGAPTHVLLPDVAKSLGVECIIPNNAEVANAIGSAIANITARVEMEIAPIYTPGGCDGYQVRSSDMCEVFEELEDAQIFGCHAAEKLAVEQARARGAIGKLAVSSEIRGNLVDGAYGTSINLGMKIIAIATTG